VGFQLVIAEGKEAGREFVFEQASVVIGRTSECDVVLYDPGVSRRHARIFSEGAGYAVEDMGSSNGTKVNGAQVKKKVLADGDTITLGPVVFNFVGLEIGADTAPPDAETNPGSDGGNSTRIVSAAEVKRSRNKGVAMVPAGADEKALKELNRTSTKTMQAVSRPRASGSVAVRRGAGQNAPLSAAERARLKRQGSSLQLFWADATPGKRRALLGGGAALGLLIVAGGLWAALGKTPPPPPPPEPTELTINEIHHSFGLSADPDNDPVTYQRSDQKVFDFELHSPTRVAVVLMYQAKDVSGGEVTIALNGRDVGTVAADAMDTTDRVRELLLPSLVVQQTQPNQIVFDNVHNPPGADPWRIYNLRLEVTPLPEGSTQELLQNAQQRFGKGIELYDRRRVASPNTWDAYRAFRETWLMLEALPEPRPPLYDQARDKMKEANQELESNCSKLMLEANSHYNQHDFKGAVETLEHVNQYFPDPRHHCPQRALAQRELWEL